MLNVSRLAPITIEDWQDISDIVLPIETGDGIVDMDFLTNQAVCYAGDTVARRLFGGDVKVEDFADSVLTAASVRVAEGRKRFRLDFGRASGMEPIAFRAQLGNVVSGHDLTLRVLPRECPTLKDLALPSALKALLLGRTLLDGGLILIVAPHGQGKTTTASATVVSRLATFGGYAQTLEDPCEMPMAGVWGNGVCIQRPVEFSVRDETPGDGFFRGMVDSMRQFPAIPQGTQMLVGEIQDSRTAVETLKLAMHGHLVVATMHSRSPADAVRRLAQLCAHGRDNMDPETARDMVASTLRGVWYQSLARDRSAKGWSRGVYGGSLLWNEANVRQAIGEGRTDRLEALSKQQTEVMLRLGSQAALTSAEVSQALARAGGS